MFRCWTRERAARPQRFVQREIGDVLIAWENEAFLSIKELGPDKVEIVVPVAEHSGRTAGFDRG